MGEAAEQPDTPAADGNVVALRPEGAPVALDRTAEGGVTLRFAFDIPKLPSFARVGSWTHQQLVNGALILAVAGLLAFVVYDHAFAPPPAIPHEVSEALRPNVRTGFNPTVKSPLLGAGAYVDRLASVIGDVHLGKSVFVAPFASVRGDEGQPIVIGDGSNVQDGVVVHALETFDGQKPVESNLVAVDGKKYAVYVGRKVSLAHQSQVHGPAAIGDNTFVGMQALVFRATVGKNVVIEPGAKVIGVNVAEGRYVPAGTVVTTQAQADALPKITPDYAFATLNEGVLHVNQAFAEAYGGGQGASADGSSAHP